MLRKSHSRYEFVTHYLLTSGRVTYLWGRSLRGRGGMPLELFKEKDLQMMRKVAVFFNSQGNDKRGNQDFD